MNLFGVIIHREPAGIISVGTCWVALDRRGPWLYTNSTLLGLMYQLIREWRSDRHLVG